MNENTVLAVLASIVVGAFVGQVIALLVLTAFERLHGRYQRFKQNRVRYKFTVTAVVGGDYGYHGYAARDSEEAKRMFYAEHPTGYLLEIQRAYQ